MCSFIRFAAEQPNQCLEANFTPYRLQVPRLLSRYVCATPTGPRQLRLRGPLQGHTISPFPQDPIDVIAGI